MANITKIEATMDDGSVIELFPIATVAAPTVAEVDVKMSDGSEQIETPAPAPAA